MVSPTANPGSSPAGAGGSTAAAASRKPLRSPPAACCHHGAGVTSWGGPRTRSTAIVRSRRPAGASRPSAVALCPGSNPAHPSAGAMSSTLPPTLHCPASTCAPASADGTRTCPAVPGLEP
ncbi:MAG TPA: hypothetical protein VGN22_00205 [Pseudonocardia sp.]